MDEEFIFLLICKNTGDLEWFIAAKCPLSRGPDWGDLCISLLERPSFLVAYSCPARNGYPDCHLLKMRNNFFTKLVVVVVGGKGK